jgi:hypothetical protein
MRGLLSRRAAAVLGTVALVSVGGSLITVTVAQAASGHHGQAAAKKKKKKKKKTTVLVRCAAVTVTCKGRPGPQGPAGRNGTNGTNGTNGANGANGMNGSALAANAHTTAPFQTPTGSSSSLPVPGNVPLTGNAWIQQPGEVDYITGQANVTAPATCVSSGNSGFAATLYLDGSSIGFAPAADLNMLDGYTGARTFDLRAFFNALGRDNGSSSNALTTGVLVLPAPAAATAHTLAAGVMDICTASGSPHYTLNSMEIEVSSAH